MNVKDASEYRGRRNQVHDILCSKHGTIKSFPIERLVRNLAYPCDLCRKELTGTGVVPSLVVETYKRRTRDDGFRPKAIQYWGAGETCQLTGIEFQPTSGRAKIAGRKPFQDEAIDVHHLNSKESYPALKTTVKYNSIPLLRPIHLFYHRVFLKEYATATAYDPVARKLSFPPQANVKTFVYFLLQLKRDLVSPHPDSLLNRVNRIVDTVVKRTEKIEKDLNVKLGQNNQNSANKQLKKETVLKKKPSPITEAKLNELIDLLESGPYQELFLSEEAEETANAFLESVVIRP